MIEKMDTAERRSASLGRSGGAIWVIGLMAMLPLLSLYLMALWRFEHYRYFPFAILLTVFLVWDRWDRRIVAPSGIVAWAAVAGSLGLLVAGGLLYSPWIGAFAFVLFAGTCLFLHRAQSGERLVFAWLPLLMLLRLPMNYDQRIVVGLQDMTTRTSSYLLDVFAVSHNTLGNIIQLPDRELLVAEACSGVQSAFTLCFIAIGIVAWRRRPVALVPLFLGFSLLWALAANVARVTSIAVAATGGFDLSTGWAHEALGYVVLLAAAGLVLSTDHFLRIVWHPMVAAEDIEDGNPLVRFWNWSLGFSDDPGPVVPTVATPVANVTAGDGDARADEHAPLAADQKATVSAAPRRRLLAGGAVMLLALLANYPLAVRFTTGAATSSDKPDSLFFAPEPSMLGDVAGEARFVDHRSIRNGDDPRLGQHADLWKVQHSQFRGELIFSQPYACWHDLSICYRNRDWIEVRKYIVQTGGSAGGTDKVAVNTFQNRAGVRGYLLYTGFRESGHVVEPPADSLLGAAMQRTRDLIHGTNSPGGELENHAMLQLWIVTNTPLDKPALDQAIDTLGRVRDRFVESIQRDSPSSMASAAP